MACGRCEVATQNPPCATLVEMCTHSCMTAAQLCSSCDGGCQDSCEGCNSCLNCNNSCQGSNSCSGCNTCQGTCNTKQAECSLGRQTPLTSNFFTTYFNNKPNYNGKPITEYNNYFKPIFNTVKAIKNKYQNYTVESGGQKPFANWNGPFSDWDSTTVNASAQEIKAQFFNDIINNTAIKNSDLISAAIMNGLWTNIGNYPYNTTLCADCNTTCNVSCNSCNSDCESCLACNTCNTRCNNSCQSCNTCNSNCNAGYVRV